MLLADIFVRGTPIWMGQPSSVAKRELERMDAFLSETSGRRCRQPQSRARGCPGKRGRRPSSPCHLARSKSWQLSGAGLFFGHSQAHCAWVEGSEDFLQLRFHHRGRRLARLHPGPPPLLPFWPS